MIVMLAEVFERLERSFEGYVEKVKRAGFKLLPTRTGMEDVFINSYHNLKFEGIPVLGQGTFLFFNRKQEMKEENIIEELKRKVEEGGQVTREEALALSRVEDKKALYEAAGAIRDRFAGRYFDTCSIVNARSGRCSENCKWCAQSAVFKTHVQEYELIDEESCMELARLNAKYGVNKFSFVTSGRSLSDKNIDKLCEYAVKIKQEMKINLCASMGLLTREQLKRLKDAGITRYHCNLETSRRYFSTLCTSHSTDEKIETIRHALELGMEVCSGGSSAWARR